jgi:FdhD protein
MAPFKKIDIIHMQEQGIFNKKLAVTTESPLIICINGDLFDQIMRTPGDEKELITGLLHSNIMISSPDDIKNFRLSESEHGEIVHVQLQVKQTEILSDTKGTDNCLNLNNISITDILNCINTLSKYQPVRMITRSTHAAILFDNFFNVIAAKEDIGRHNALDKVIGQTLMENTLGKASILVLSSRVSHELITKVINTPVKCIFSVSRPTSLAVEIARIYNITLACLSKKDGVLIFSGFQRFDLSDTQNMTPSP